MKTLRPGKGSDLSRSQSWYVAKSGFQLSPFSSTDGSDPTELTAGRLSHVLGRGSFWVRMNLTQRCPSLLLIEDCVPLRIGQMLTWEDAAYHDMYVNGKGIFRL